MTDSSPGATSPFASLPNWRDLGYWPTADGKTVRPKVLYRTTEFLKTTDADIKAVGELGLRTLIDLRTVAERASCPDPVYANIGPLWLNILEDIPHTAGANPARFVSDPSAVRALTADNAKAMMIATYGQLITSDSALKGYAEFYTLLLDEDLAPAAFHCTTGKDRTGWAAASFLGLMGVDRDDIYRDYLLTNDRLVPALEPIIDQMAKQGVDTAAIKELLGVDKAYLDHAFELVEKNFGSLPGYFSDGLGIDAAAQRELRSRYTVAG
ncbi:MAG: tyrosine-protein phosphatase [Gordonia sp. (in: high G+C Gram-positive bacteria)]|uniref:tyrosine-protein phosphatase n=1 Tax=Gordonia sp. (in: high G+C Gram-positive bacteria) TaxID=84139 RepID=UPI003BB7BB5A